MDLESLQAEGQANTAAEPQQTELYYVTCYDAGYKLSKVWNGSAWTTDLRQAVSFQYQEAMDICLRESDKYEIWKKRNPRHATSHLFSIQQF